ncbi:MAG: LamG domain-containing protein, partial [Phycisphaerae bacterium]|nr:LamG domain-containing protein [Phycisphaerae bacterium]
MLRQNRGLLVSVLVTAFISQGFAANASRAYVKKDTWQATFLQWQDTLHRSAAQAEPVVMLPDFGADDFTVMVWIQTRKDGTIAAKTNPTGVWVSQGKSFFIQNGRLTVDVGWVGAVQGRSSVTDGQWHHVALTCRDQTLTFFVDGQKDGGGRLDVRPDGAEFVFKVGYTSDNFPGKSGFEGLMDELRVFDGALSARAIRVWQENPESGETAHLAGYWPLDGDQKDASGHGHDPIRSTTSESAAGKQGQALVFKGNDLMMFAASDRMVVLGEMWARLARDFQDDRSVQEMAWEQEDGLWDKDFESGNWQALAQRYVGHCERVPEIAARAKRAVTQVSDAGSLAEIRELYYRSRRQAQADAALGSYNPEGLRRAVKAMIDQGDSQGTVYLKRLDLVDDLVTAWVSGQTRVDLDWEALKKSLGDLSHDILVAETDAMDFQKIIFVKRYTYQSSHYYTDYIDGCEKYGGNICVLDLGTGEVRDIVPAMKHGIFGRYDLSFDGERVVFDWKEKEGVGFRIYEVRVDGTGLRQLTFPPADEAARIEK